MTRRLFSLGAGLALAASLTACTRDAAPTAGNANANMNHAPAAPVRTGPADPDAPQEVTFTTKDGVTITGDLYLPEKSPAPAILALHQWQSDRSSYREFAKTMRAQGFVVLAIDARGFGGSKLSSDGPVQPAKNDRADIDAAVEQLESQPAVDALRIGIVGASYGASNALIYAAERPDKIRAVALLSPGLAYDPSIQTEPAMKKYGERPILLVSAKDDAESSSDTEKLAAAGKAGKVRLKMYDAGGHGIALLASSVGGAELVKQFFVETLTGPIAAREKATGNTDAEGGGSAPEGRPSNENSGGGGK